MLQVASPEDVSETVQSWPLRKAPAIIFIDELDAIGQKRSGGGELSGVREVQRTMLELLNQLAT